MVWSNGKDRGDRRSSDYISQLEGICEIALPGVNARKMDDHDLSCLMNYPLHVAVAKLVKPLDHVRSRPVHSPLLPPPKSKDPSDVFPFPEPEAINGDGPLLGMVISNGKDIAPLALYLKDIQRHVSVFGTTGSGKSTTAISLALRLFSMGVSVLILDWHGEHTKIVRARRESLLPGICRKWSDHKSNVLPQYERDRLPDRVHHRHLLADLSVHAPSGIHVPGGLEVLLQSQTQSDDF